MFGVRRSCHAAWHRSDVGGENPFYCEHHAEGEKWIFLPVVNSPRMGVCGYPEPLEP